MKKIITIVSMLLAVNASALNLTGQKIAKDPQTVSVSGYLVKDAGLAYDANYILDVGPYSRISAEVNYGSTTFSPATFSDGQEGAGSFTIESTTSLSGVKLQIGRFVLVAGTDYAIKATPTLTAVNFVSSITALGIFPDVTFSNTGAVVFASATVNGTAHNYGMVTSNAAKISVVPMTGGTNAAFSVGSANIALPLHGFTAALPVLYSSAAAKIGGLTDQTTYYAIVVDANNIQLATTSARALLGLPLSITSVTNQATARLSTLTALPIAGTPSFAWSVSNDGINYVVYPSSGGIAIGITDAATSSIVDFGAFAYRWLKMAVTAPTAGAIKIEAYFHGKE